MARCLFFTSSVIGSAPIPRVTTGPSNVLSCSLDELLKIYGRVRTWHMSFRLAVSAKITNQLPYEGASEEVYQMDAIFEYGGSPTSHLTHDTTIDVTNFDESFLVYGGGWQVKYRPPTGTAGSATVTDPLGYQTGGYGYEFWLQVDVLRGTLPGETSTLPVTKLAGADVYYPSAEVLVGMNAGFSPFFPTIPYPDPEHPLYGMSGQVSFSAGTLGGSNRTLRVSLDGHTWTVPAGLSITASNSYNDCTVEIISEEISDLVLTPLDYWEQANAKGEKLFNGANGAPILDEHGKPLWLTATLN